MPPAESLLTPRLLLRQPIDPDDAPRIFQAYASDPEVTRYVTWLPHRSEDETRQLLTRRVARWAEGIEYSWVVTERTTGAVIGMVSATGDGTRWRYSIGYVLARAHWGRGFAREAAGAVVEELFRHPQVHRVWAVADVDNLASARVLAAIGMQHEGVLQKWSMHPGIGSEPRDCLCYSRTR